MSSIPSVKIGIVDGTKLYQLLRAYCKDNLSSPIIQAVQNWDGLLFTSSLTLERVIQRLIQKEELTEEEVRKTAESKLALLDIEVVPVKVYQTYPLQSNLQIDDDDASILLLAESIKNFRPEAEVVIISHDKDFRNIVNYLQQKGIVLQGGF